jgi:hypothetical protein
VKQSKARQNKAKQLLGGLTETLRTQHCLLQVRLCQCMPERASPCLDA